MSGSTADQWTGYRSGWLLAGRIGIGVAFLAAWQLLTGVGVLDPFFFARPSDVLGRLWEWLTTGYILDDLALTLQEAGLAFVIGVLAGMLVGFWLARSPIAAALLDPYITMLNALPRVVLAPIFLLWFGLGIWSKVAFGITLVFFIVFFNTYQGVREVDSVLVDNVRMLGATPRQLVRTVYLPAALSWIFSSLHVSVGFALVGAVVGEYRGASGGVGYVIAQAEGTFDTTGVFAGMALLMIVVVVIDRLVVRVERRLLRWHPSRLGS